VIEERERAIGHTRAQTRLRVLTWSAIAIYAASSAASIALYSQFWTSERMGDNVPWYYIGRSFFGGVWAVAAMLLVGMLAFAIGRDLGRSVWGAVMPALLFLSPPLAQGINVLLHTQRIWSPTTAVSQWHTFDDFLRSDAIAMFVGIVLAAAILAPLWKPWEPPPRSHTSV